MKKYILILILASCNSPEKHDEKEFVSGSKYTTTFVYDSCEYVVLESTMTANVGSITHKGNCKFCKQRNTINPK